MRTNKLILKYIELSNLKNGVMDSIKKYSPEEINHNPSREQWSLAQVIEHIIETETGVNKYINYKTKTIDNQPKAGLRSYVSSKFLNKNLKSDKKFKVPSIVSSPKPGSDFDELKEKWDTARMFLIQTVENFPINKSNKVVFKHPVAGFLNINQTLAFLINHLNHHLLQINSLKLIIDNQNKKRQ